MEEKERRNLKSSHVEVDEWKEEEEKEERRTHTQKKSRREEAKEK